MRLKVCQVQHPKNCNSIVSEVEMSEGKQKDTKIIIDYIVVGTGTSAST